jgi:hypothetical protein
MKKEGGQGPSARAREPLGAQLCAFITTIDATLGSLRVMSLVSKKVLQALICKLTIGNPQIRVYFGPHGIYQAPLRN